MKLSPIALAAIAGIALVEPSLASGSLRKLQQPDHTPPLQTHHGHEEKHHRKLPPAWKNQCKINGEKIGIYVGGGTGPSSKLWAEALAVFWQTGNRGPNDQTKLNVGGGNTFTGSSETSYVTLNDR